MANRSEHAVSLQGLTDGDLERFTAGQLFGAGEHQYLDLDHTTYCSGTDLNGYAGSMVVLRWISRHALAAGPCERRRASGRSFRGMIKGKTPAASALPLRKPKHRRLAPCRSGIPNTGG